jgi:uncharacterized membrane protein YeaQ/YmgE (transglycosylase-associated protein family)
MDLTQLDVWGVILLVIVAGVCGAIGQAIAGYSRGGCLASIALGFIGAVLGIWLFPKLGLPELLTVKIGDVGFPIVWSVIGATIFVAVISLIARRPRYYP